MWFIILTLWILGSHKVSITLGKSVPCSNTCSVFIKSMHFFAFSTGNWSKNVLQAKIKSDGFFLLIFREFQSTTKSYSSFSNIFSLKASNSKLLTTGKNIFSSIPWGTYFTAQSSFGWSFKTFFTIFTDCFEIPNNISSDL